MNTTPENNCYYCGKLSANANTLGPLEGPHLCIDCLRLLNEGSAPAWTEDYPDFQLAVLQLLYSVRLKKRARVVTESMIRRILDLDENFNSQPACSILMENGHIQHEGDGFLITDRGVQFILERFPSLTRLDDR